MAVLEMKRVTICALKKDRKKILELLQHRGVIEVNEINHKEKNDDGVFIKPDVTSAIGMLNKSISTAKEALEIIESYSPIKKSLLAPLKGREEVESSFYSDFSKKHDEVLAEAVDVCALNKSIAERKAEILRLKIQKDLLSAWTSFDLPVNFKGTKYTRAFIGSFSREINLDDLYNILSGFSPIEVEIISTTKTQTCVFILCHVDNAESVSDRLRTQGFTLVQSDYENSPAENIKDIENRIKNENNGINEDIQKILSLSSRRDDFYFLYDYDKMRLDKYNVIGQLLQSKSTFVLTGFIPEKYAKSLDEDLNTGFTVATEFSIPDEKDDVPVLLSNNGFAAPLEGVVESYSLPGRGEADPTSVMAIFYYVLFGLMLSDAVYGFIIALGCALGLTFFKKTLENSMRNTLKMYLFCGISTVFWGVMFGSYLGDIVDVVSETFFGQKITVPPMWFFPLNEPMRMLVASMIIGLVHLFTGLGMKFYLLAKQKDIKSIFYDVISWYVLIIGCILKLLTMEMFADILGLKETIAPVYGNVGSVLAVISSIVIILTNGRESKNPFKRFLKGLYAFYGITGYLSDVLSYSRLLALGLATGVIGSVINKMAAMASGIGPKFVGAIIFIIIVIGGHILNIGINALGAYVHTNRLQYVEFFGKFYSGGSRKFDPFKAKTKYYKFKENK